MSGRLRALSECGANDAMVSPLSFHASDESKSSSAGETVWGVEEQRLRGLRREHGVLGRVDGGLQGRPRHAERLLRPPLPPQPAAHVLFYPL